MKAGTPQATAVLFVLTVFVSASLLFFVQPLFSKIVLPEIGGAPAVWTTAMLFFQTVLIGGYLYAHLSSKWLPPRVQLWLHLAFWAIALIALPLGIPADWTFDATAPPVPQTLMLFAVGVGLPFAVLSANAPLLQSWYARSGGPSADDPYFLYAASNLGSLIALLAFPLLAENLLGTTRIAYLFAIGYCVLGALLLLSGLRARGGQTAPTRSNTSEPVPGLTLGTLAYWALLAFVPSSMMLALTTTISTDFGALPMIWIVPLSLYLLSFVLAFSKKIPFSPRGTIAIGTIGVAVLFAFFTNLFGEHVSATSTVIAMAAFFLLAIWAHRRLYYARPAPANLTVFYLTMSIGGALGGLFNSIIAPVIFHDIYEAQTTLAVAILLMIAPFLRLTYAVLIRAVLFGLGAGVAAILAQTVLQLDKGIALALGFGAALLAALFFLRQTRAAGLAFAVAILCQLPFLPDDQLFRDRSFFGVHRIADQDDIRVYGNGTTVHGIQILADYEKPQPQPTSYYHPNGAMGQILTSHLGADATQIGIVGLGVGSLACYAKEGQTWEYYEIDALVDDVARDANLFTFLASCTPDAPTHIGDARIVLETQTGKEFDILVIDAYSSNSIPLHLTTREAVQLYLDRVSDRGVILFHISNRYYDVWRPLSRIAADLEIPAWQQTYLGDGADGPGFTGSQVVALTQAKAAKGYFEDDPRWTPLISDGGSVWTDDFANPLSVLKVLTE